MADLNPLIRVRKHSVEQKQKFLAELYRQAEELMNRKQNIIERMREERKTIEQENSVDMLAAYNTYVDAAKDQIANLNAAMEKLEVRIELARDDMREAFSDLKKVEITQERREAEEIAALEKKQAELLDEVALDGFRRRIAEE